jgi:hypothetical protein
LRQAPRENFASASAASFGRCGAEVIDRNALKLVALLMAIQRSVALTTYTVADKYFLLEIIGFLNKELGPSLRRLTRQFSSKIPDTFHHN